VDDHGEGIGVMAKDSTYREPIDGGSVDFQALTSRARGLVENLKASRRLDELDSADRRIVVEACELHLRRLEESCAALDFLSRRVRCGHLQPADVAALATWT